MTVAAVERLIINGPAGALETLVDEAGPASSRYAVVCHPHPLYGGTMDNKVVTTLAHALHGADIATLRYNFRGVGGSAGSFDAGIGETADAECVAAWGASRWPGRELVIAGFSFGAYVALQLAQRVQASQLVTIAPPVAMFDFSKLVVPGCPWLVVQGDADDVVDPDSVIRWVGGLEPSPQLLVMRGVGHFFHGRLTELGAAVTNAVRGG
jgi:alpha/beta superfamily hydrolase